MLRNVTAPQDTRKGQTWPQGDMCWPNRVKTGRPIKALRVQRRAAVQRADAGRPGLAEATGKEGRPDPAPYPLGMRCKMTDVRFPLNDLSA